MTTANTSDSHRLLNLLRRPEPDKITSHDILLLRDQVTQFLFLSDQAGPVDLCLVLGAPTPSNVDPAIFLYKSGFTDHILLSGYGPIMSETPQSFVPEHVKMRQRALDAGVPPDKILEEKSATNTLENFVNSFRIIDSHFGWQNISSVAIAGKPLHMRRALLTACKQWPNHIKLLMQPTQATTDIQSYNWWKSEIGQQRVLKELQSISTYSAQGDIQSV